MSTSGVSASSSQIIKFLESKCTKLSNNVRKLIGNISRIKNHTEKMVKPTPLGKEWKNDHSLRNIRSEHIEHPHSYNNCNSQIHQTSTQKMSITGVNVKISNPISTKDTPLFFKQFNNRDAF